MSGLEENENSSFDFEYWYMEQPLRRTSNSFSPSTLLSCECASTRGPNHALDQALGHTFYKGWPSTAASLANGSAEFCRKVKRKKQF